MTGMSPEELDAVVLAVARGEGVTEAYRAVEDLAVHRRPWPVEY